MSPTILLDPTSVKRRYLARLGCEAYVYIDTIYVYVEKVIPGLWRKLHRANVRPGLSTHDRLISDKLVKGHWLTIHQPTRKVMEVLQEHDLAVNAVHVAFDMSLEDGERVNRQRVMNRRGDAQQVETENVTYAKPKYSKPDPLGRVRVNARNSAYYDDKPSKVTGEPCGHLEFRLHGVAATRRAGLDDPAVYLSGDFDLEEFLTKQVRLALLGKRWQRFLHKLAGKLRNRKRHYKGWELDDISADQMEWLRRALQRFAQTEHHTPHYPTMYDVPAQVIADYLDYKIEGTERPIHKKGVKERLKRLLESPLGQGKRTTCKHTTNYPCNYKHLTLPRLPHDGSAPAHDVTGVQYGDDPLPDPLPLPRTTDPTDRLSLKGMSRDGAQRNPDTFLCATERQRSSVTKRLLNAYRY